jgi:hypothetical protein
MVLCSGARRGNSQARSDSLSEALSDSGLLRRAAREAQARSASLSESLSSGLLQRAAREAQVWAGPESKESKMLFEGRPGDLHDFVFKVSTANLKVNSRSFLLFVVASFCGRRYGS